MTDYAQNFAFNKLKIQEDKTIQKKLIECTIFMIELQKKKKKKEANKYFF